MLILVGCSHRSAPIALRERLAFAEEDLRPALEALVRQPGIREGMILSTCNRVELLARHESCFRTGVELLKRFLVERRGVTPDEIERHTYHHLGNEAVRHLFHVATGLDSMILGEPQILGQVRQAYRTAREAGSTDRVLERMLQQCLTTAKRVRTSTGISRHVVSVASASVRLAQQIFDDLAGRTALLIGAGKMAELVAKHLETAGIGRILVTSRTFNRAVVSAEKCHGTPLHWDDGLARLGEADIVVSCTGAPQPILTRSAVASVMRDRRHGPLFLIDIAVPRDVAPDVNQLDNVYLYDIDGLQQVVDANVDQRRRAARLAHLEIVADVEAFDRWRQGLEVTPTIVALRERFFDLARGEVERHRRRLGPLSPESERVVDEMARSMVQKLLHHPVVHLRRSVERGEVDRCVATYREIFGLSDGDERAAAADGQRPAPRPGPRELLRGGKRN